MTTAACITRAAMSKATEFRRMPVTFDESRRLTGTNVFFEHPGAALEAIGTDISDAVIDEWQNGIQMARLQLGWPDADIVWRRHVSGVSLAFAAPDDQLMTATEVNEWALTRAAQDAGAQALTNELPQVIIEMAQQEADPALMALITAARERNIPAHWDDEFFTAGEGHFAHHWPANQLPDVSALDAESVGRIKKAIVTGSNGKTTVTRALAKILSMAGLHAGYSSTDGIVVDGQVIEEGDFSGPMGLRSVLRNPSVEVAILETARGGLLRRGLATQDADVAIVTNVSADHFGEYGVHSLDDLREVKLLVRKSLRPNGMLVVNAGDEEMVARIQAFPDMKKGWFGRSLQQARALGLPACGIERGRLRLVTENGEWNLGETIAMPIGLHNMAPYNLENLAAAALAAHVLGVDAERIADALVTFGKDSKDNPGRLQYWSINGVHVLLDYAHNPDGLQSLLDVAHKLGNGGRMGLLLEQAGNRTDQDIRDLATVGALAQPERVWIKDLGGEYTRGRAKGAVMGILSDALLGAGLTAHQVIAIESIEQLITESLEWAEPGDVLVLPIHASDERDLAIALLNLRGD